MSTDHTRAMLIAEGRPVEPGSPLHQRAPGRDADGRPVSDLMLLFPGLKKGLPAVVDRVSQELTVTLAGFGERVLFAELNLKLGLLWVSVRAEPGLCHEVAQTVRARLPETRVVGSWLEGPQRERLAGPQSSYSDARLASPRTRSRG